MAAIQHCCNSCVLYLLMQLLDLQGIKSYLQQILCCLWSWASKFSHWLDIRYEYFLFHVAMWILFFSSWDVFVLYYHSNTPCCLTIIIVKLLEGGDAVCKQNYLNSYNFFFLFLWVLMNVKFQSNEQNRTCQWQQERREVWKSKKSFEG